MRDREISKIGKCLRFIMWLFLPVLALGFCGETLADGPTEVEYQLRAPLVRAGIPIERESLIQALHHKDVVVAGNSAILLARFPKTKKMIDALTSLVETDKDSYRETVVVNAARTLLQLKEHKWEAAAVVRLSTFHDTVAKVLLAGVLAQAGHADGWQIVRATLFDAALAPVAAVNAQYFNGLKDSSGNTIDVKHELAGILPQLPESTRKLIEERLRNFR